VRDLWILDGSFRNVGRRGVVNVPWPIRDLVAKKLPIDR
jgi:hypothetical protein